MSAIMRPGYPDLYDLSIPAQGYAVEEYNRVPVVFPEICQVIPSNYKEEKGSSFSGFGEMSIAAEGGDYTDVDFVEGYDWTSEHTTTKNQFKVTEEAWEDDRKGVLSNMETFSRAFGEAARFGDEKAVAAVYNGAFTTILTPDGQYLVDTDHPINPEQTGTVLSNKITTALDANGAAIEEMYEKFSANGKTMSGHPIAVSSFTLLVPNALAVNAHKNAMEIFGTTSATNIAGTTAPTPISSGDLMGKLKVVVNPYLGAAYGGSDTAWFMIATPSTVMKGRHSILFFDRIPLTIHAMTAEEKTGNYLIKARRRRSVKARDWRLVWGSTGGG